VQITVSDGVNPVTIKFSWTVNVPPNLAPIVTTPANQSHTQGNSVSLQINASDPELQPLTYAALGLPTGLSINPNTGLISGTIATGAANNSPYAVQITVSDGVNPVVRNFTWTVNAAPTGPHVTSLTLINAGTNSPVAEFTPLTDGAVISLSNYEINIVANTTGSISQIQFKVNGQVFRTEGVAPYALAGDAQPNYYVWYVQPGVYTITATPLNNPSGAITITITITN
jgi:hypothetical protein